MYDFYETKRSADTLMKFTREIKKKANVRMTVCFLLEMSARRGELPT